MEPGDGNVEVPGLKDKRPRLTTVFRDLNREKYRKFGAFLEMSREGGRERERD